MLYNQDGKSGLGSIYFTLNLKNVFICSAMRVIITESISVTKVTNTTTVMSGSRLYGGE